MKKILILGVLLILAVGCGRINPPPSPEVTEREIMKGRIESTAALCRYVASKHDVDSGGGHGSWPDERPFFGLPNRVFSIEELKVGETYLLCGLEYGAFIPFTISSGPHKGKRSPAVDVIWWHSGVQDSFDLADMGIVPYTSGKWNPVNVLLYILPPVELPWELGERP